MVWPLVAFLVAAGLLLALVFYVQDRNKWVDHTDVVIGRATLVERLVVDRESRLRTYLISGDAQFLEFYREADGRLPPAIDALEKLVSYSPPQVARLASMRAALARWRQYADHQLARSRDVTAAQDVPFHLLDGEAVSNYIRSRLREFIEFEEGLRVGRVERANAVTRWAFLVGLGFVLVLGPALALTTAQQMRRSRLRYREALEAQERTARSLLESENALRESDRRKDEFLGMLSHELRNPLAPIRNSVHVLARVAPASAQAEQARAIIARQVDHLARLVDDLLDVKRISTGKLRLHADLMDLTRQVRETVEDMRPLFMNRSLLLHLEMPRQAVWVNGDRTRLAQVVSNLLHNAAKFTDAGGRVSVTVEDRDGQVHIRVRDQGVGVAPDMLGKLFDAFVQSDRTLHRTKGGLGLGLWLVRGITELHGGTVVARSEGDGKGTEFVVTLPTVKAAAATGTDEPAAPEGGVRRRVLVIEDNVDAAESLRHVLEMIGGHEVVVANDGEAGVAAARQHSPDVILCDIGLPAMDGYEVARQIRAGGMATRLIALSGYASAEDIDRAIRSGFDFHIAKPPDIDRVLGLVASAPSAAARAVPADIATGHHEVDAQHAAILAQLARLRTDSPDASRESLRLLRQQTASHFKYEEMLMEEVGYPDLAAHKQQHADFLHRVRGIQERLERDGARPGDVGVLADTVETWVMEHVLDQDRRLAAFIRSRAPEPQGEPGGPAPTRSSAPERPPSRLRVV